MGTWHPNRVTPPHIRSSPTFSPFYLVLSFFLPHPHDTLTPFVSLSEDSDHLSCDGREDADGDSEDEANRQSQDPELGR